MAMLRLRTCASLVLGVHGPRGVEGTFCFRAHALRVEGTMFSSSTPYTKQQQNEHRQESKSPYTTGITLSITNDSSVQKSSSTSKILHYSIPPGDSKSLNPIKNIHYDWNIHMESFLSFCSCDLRQSRPCSL